MKENVRPVSPADALAVPAMVIVGAFLQMWLQKPAAVAASVVLVLATLSLFRPRRVTYKRLLLILLLIGLASYSVTALYVRSAGGAS